MMISIYFDAQKKGYKKVKKKLTCKPQTQEEQLIQTVPP